MVWCLQGAESVRDERGSLMLAQTEGFCQTRLFSKLCVFVIGWWESNQVYEPCRYVLIQGSEDVEIFGLLEMVLQ